MISPQAGSMVSFLREDFLVFMCLPATTSDTRTYGACSEENNSNNRHNINPGPVGFQFQIQSNKMEQIKKKASTQTQ